MELNSSSQLNELVENIEKLSGVQRLAIAVAVVVLIVAGFAYFSLWDKNKDIKGLKDTYGKEKEKLAIAKKKAAELPKKRNEMKKAEAQFKLAMKQLPEKQEIPTLLTGISDAGQDVGLEFQLFQPRSEISKDFYAEIPVSMKIVGPFHNIVLFFDKTARLNRIVNIRDIQMTPVKEDKRSDADITRLMAVCEAVTYKFIEAQPDTKKKPRKRK